MDEILQMFEGQHAPPKQQPKNDRTYNYDDFPIVRKKLPSQSNNLQTSNLKQQTQDNEQKKLNDILNNKKNQSKDHKTEIKVERPEGIVKTVVQQQTLNLTQKNNPTQTQPNMETKNHKDKIHQQRQDNQQHNKIPIPRKKEDNNTSNPQSEIKSDRNLDKSDVPIIKKKTQTQNDQTAQPYPKQNVPKETDKTPQQNPKQPERTKEQISKDQDEKKLQQQQSKNRPNAQVQGMKENEKFIRKEQKEVQPSIKKDHHKTQSSNQKVKQKSQSNGAEIKKKHEEKKVHPQQQTSTQKTTVISQKQDGPKLTEEQLKERERLLQILNGGKKEKKKPTAEKKKVKQDKKQKEVFKNQKPEKPLQKPTSQPMRLSLGGETRKPQSKIKPSSQSLQQQKPLKRKQDDEYDLESSFIDDGQKEFLDSDDEREFIETLRPLRKRLIDHSDEDEDIPEDSFEQLQKQERHSRILGKIIDDRELIFIQKEEESERRKRKKI